MFSRRYLVNSCRTPKKLSFNVSLHLPLHSDQGSPFATQMKIKYAKEYSIRKTGIKVEATQLDKKIFVRLSRQLEMVNWKAYRKDRNLLQNNPNSHGYLRKKNRNVSECTAHNIFQSPLSLWASNLRLLRALWMNFTSLLKI